MLESTKTKIFYSHGPTEMASSMKSTPLFQTHHKISIEGMSNNTFFQDIYIFKIRNGIWKKELPFQTQTL